ncbi:hypothetical protein ZONE111904_16880 [Zobellia nedashkovskayae]
MFYMDLFRYIFLPINSHEDVMSTVAVMSKKKYPLASTKGYYHYQLTTKEKPLKSGLTSNPHFVLD